MLRPYLKTGLNKKERKEAYRLIVLSYLFDDLRQEATKVLMEFMELYPEYDTISSDPNDLKYLFRYKEFETKNIFSIGLAGGGIMAMPSITKSYNLEGITTNKDVQTDFGSLFGLIADFRVIDHLDISTGVYYSSTRFGFHQLVDEGLKTEYYETWKNMILPLWVTPYINIKKNKLYLKIGGGANMLLDSKADVSLDQLNNNIDVLENRNPLTFFMSGGIGFSLKIPHGIISLEGNYLNGLGNLTKSRDENGILANDYQYIDDDFKLNGLMFTLGYKYQFYKLKERK